MKHWMTGLASLAFVCAAHAQEEPAQPDRDGWLMTSISFDDLEYIVETDDYELGQAIPDDIAVMAISPSGTPYFMQGTACSADGTCQGLHIWMSFAGQMTPEEANRLNYDYAAVSVIVLNNTSFQVSRYLILDHGTTMANIKANLLNFLAIGDQIWTTQRARNIGASVGETAAEQGPIVPERPPEPEDDSEDTIETSAEDGGEPVSRLN